MPTNYLGQLKPMSGAVPGQFGDFSGMRAAASALGSIANDFSGMAARQKAKDDVLFNSELKTTLSTFLADQEKDEGYWSEVDGTEDLPSLATRLQDKFGPLFAARQKSPRALAPEQEAYVRESLTQFAIHSKAKRDAVGRTTRIRENIGSQTQAVVNAPDANHFAQALGNLRELLYGKGEEQLGLLGLARDEREASAIRGLAQDSYSQALSALAVQSVADPTSFKTRAEELIATLPNSETDLIGDLRSRAEAINANLNKPRPVTNSDFNRLVSRFAETGEVDRALLDRCTSDQQDQFFQISTKITVSQNVKDAITENLSLLFAEDPLAPLEEGGFFSPLKVVTSEERENVKRGLVNWAKERLADARTYGAVAILKDDPAVADFMEANPLFDEQGQIIPENVERVRQQLEKTLAVKGLADREIPVILGGEEFLNALTTPNLSDAKKMQHVGNFLALNRGALGVEVLTQQLKNAGALPKEQAEALRTSAPLAFLGLMMGTTSPVFQQVIAAQNTQSTIDTPSKQKLDLAIKSFLEEDANAQQISQALTAMGGPEFAGRVWQALGNYAVASSNASSDLSPETATTLLDAVIRDNFFTVGSATDSPHVSLVPAKAQLGLYMEDSLWQKFLRNFDGEYRASTSDDRALIGELTEEAVLGVARGLDDIGREGIASEGYVVSSLFRNIFRPIFGGPGNRATPYLSLMREQGALTGGLLDGADWSSAVNLADPSPGERLSSQNQELYADVISSLDRGEANKRVFFSEDEEGRRLGGLTTWSDKTGRQYLVPAIRMAPGDPTSDPTAQSAGMTIVADKEGNPIFRIPVEQAVALGYQVWRMKKGTGLFSRSSIARALFVPVRAGTEVSRHIAGAFGVSEGMVTIEDYKTAPGPLATIRADALELEDFLTPGEREARRLAKKKRDKTIAENPRPSPVITDPWRGAVVPR